MSLHYLRFLSGILAVAALGGIAAYGGAGFFAQPPKPDTWLAWLVFLLTPVLLGVASILAIIIGVPLLRGGYPKLRATTLPAWPLRLGSGVLVVASLCLARFGYLTRRDVLYFLAVAGQTLWLSYLQIDITEPDA
jgi:hypothetical protein